MLSKLWSAWIGISGDKKQVGSKVGNGGTMNNVKAFHEIFSFFFYSLEWTRGGGYLDTDWMDESGEKEREKGRKQVGEWVDKNEEGRRLWEEWVARNRKSTVAGNCLRRFQVQPRGITELPAEIRFSRGTTSAQLASEYATIALDDCEYG